MYEELHVHALEFSGTMRLRQEKRQILPPKK
jgi:hypothetical protein